MTAKDIATVIGRSSGQEAGKDERACLLAADEQALAILAAGESVVMHESSAHYDWFDRVAAASWPGAEQMQADLAELHQWDADTEVIRNQSPRGSDELVRDEPSAVAYAVFNPKLNAAFYLGLALGLRLAGEQR